MKKIIIQNILLALLISLYSCKNNTTNTIEKEIPNDDNNEELYDLYNNDQNERRANDIDWYKLYVNDSLRRIKVKKFLVSGKIKTGKDYSRAAMIFQHGIDSTDYKLAVNFMEIAIQKDSTINKWLLAAATDRYLLSIGKPQIYGTQYTKTKFKPWIMRNYDTTKVSDKERLKYGVGTLAQQKEKLQKLNNE